MNRDKLEQFLKKESDRVRRKRGGRKENLPDPQLNLTRRERLEQIKQSRMARKGSNSLKVRLSGSKVNRNK